MKEADKKPVLKKNNKKKRFWERWMEKLDQSMEKKANESSCCSKDSKGETCC